MKRSISILVLACFSFLLLMQDALLAARMAQQSYTVTVLPLEPLDRVSDEEAIQIGALLHDELSQYAIFEPLDPVHVDRILALNNLDPLKCSTIECATEAGRILRTQLVAFGSVKKVGPMYFVNISVLHVKTGQIVKSMSEEVEGDFEALLAQFPGLVQRLVGKSAPRNRPISQPMSEQPSVISAAPAVSSTFEENGMNPEESLSAEPETGEVGLAEPPVLNKKSSRGKWLILGLLVAGGVGAGVYYAQQKKGSSQTGSTGGLLPAPPTFP